MQFVGASLRTACYVLACAVAYYIATRIAWVLCFPDSKVSLFFPPHAVLVCILLLVPTRQWWAYVLAAAGAHFLASQQVQWPPLFALNAEAFDAVQNVLAAAGIRLLIKSPITAITRRDAILFILVAVVVGPFGTSFWGAYLTVSYGFGTHFWVEWRNLGISNAVTAVVLIPVFMLGAHHLFVRRPRTWVPRRMLEAAFVGAGTVTLGIFVFDQTPAGPNTSPALLYAPIPLLIWAAVRFGLGGISISILIITCQAIWGTMQGHGPFLTQTPAENATALQLFLLVTATPLMLLAVVIEEERRSKQALREGTNLMGLAAAAGNLAMWVWDVSANDVWMTEQGRSLLGLKPDARLDFATAFGRVHPEDRTAREGAIEQALRTRGEYDVEYRVQQTDGMTRWIHERGRCVGADNGTGGKLFAVSMDVTARKQAEASAAQKRAELEHVARGLQLESEETLRRLRRRTLQLRRLASELTLAEQHAREELAKTLHDGLQQLLFSAALKFDRMVAANSESDRVALLRRARGDLDEAMKAARTLSVSLFPPMLHIVGLPAALGWLAKRTQEQYGVDVNVTADPEANPATNDVRIFLFEAARELLFNAVKHAHVDQVDINLELGADDSINLHVSDKGVGFDPPATLHHKDHQQVGLGLFSIEERLALFGGRLDIQSAPGKGARFSLIMPRADLLRPALAGRSDNVGDQERTVYDNPNSTSKPLRILIADDHVVARAGLRELLSEQPMLQVVGEAANGVEAISQAGALQPDVVVMDVSMPQMNGFEATREIRGALPHIHIVGLSTHADENSERSMREAGAEAYFTKTEGAERLVNYLLSVQTRAKGMANS